MDNRCEGLLRGCAVDIVVESNGDAALYVYEKGKDRASGIFYRHSGFGWTSLKTYLQTSYASGASPTSVLISELTEVPGYSEQTMSAWAAMQGAKAAVLWSQPFDDASGMTALPAGYMSLQGGALVSKTVATATEAWPGVRSNAKYPFGATISAEITTGASSTGRHFIFGADSGNTGSYRRHAVYFDGGNLYALVSDASGNRSTLLGAVQNNTAYVVEVETVADGRSTIYVRPKGLPRSAGWTHTTRCPNSVCDRFFCLCNSRRRCAKPSSVSAISSTPVTKTVFSRSIAGFERRDQCLHA